MMSPVAIILPWGMELCGYKPIVTLEGVFSLLYIDTCFGHEEVLGFGPFTQRWYFLLQIGTRDS